MVFVPGLARASGKGRHARPGKTRERTPERPRLTEFSPRPENSHGACNVDAVTSHDPRRDGSLPANSRAPSPSRVGGSVEISAQLANGPLGGNSSHFSEDGLMPTLGLRGVLAAIKIRSDDDRGPAGRGESDRDIIALVGRSLSVRPVPVLFPERHSAGRPARSRLGPVSVFCIHCRRRSREPLCKRSPVVIRRTRCAIARGEVVSRKSAESTEAEIRFIAVETRHRVAHVAELRGDGGRAA